MAWFTNLLHNNCFIWCGMAVLIFLATQVIKLPIKHFTNKIQNERVRRIANSVILLIPFALGVFAEFLYSTYYLHVAFTVITGLGYGSAGIALYGIIERLFDVKVDNPYNTEEGKAVTELVDEVTKDGVVDEKDMTAVNEFLDKVKK